MRRLFSPVAWAHHTNLYEVNIRQYTPEGNFESFARHLPRLRAMGVETLWFMPITPISVDGRQGTLGSYYACSDYTAINPEFGTIDDFRKLVNEAQGLGFKVIIDWVANHTGLDHIWTQTHPEYYKKNAEGKFYDNHGWADVIDLNYYDWSMRSDMIAAMKFWVTECNIDGFRCDMAHLVPLDFWRQARQELDKIKHLFWLAETEDYHYLEVFDCCYAWQWMHDTLKYCKGEIELQHLKSTLNRYQKEFPSHTYQLFFTSNHDENSWNGTEYEKYGPAAKPLAVLSILWNGIPLIYSGQELPNTKRLKFFDKDLIEWKEKPALHGFYEALLRLRSSHPAVTAGSASAPIYVPSNADQYVFAFMRRQGGKEVLVLLNFSPNQLFVQLKEGYVHGKFTDVLNGGTADIIPHHSFEIKAWDCLVLQK
jgi:glycosidase